MAPAQKILERIGLPDAETKLQLLKLCIERLTGGLCLHRNGSFCATRDELVIAQREGTLQRNFRVTVRELGWRFADLGFRVFLKAQMAIGKM